MLNNAKDQARANLNFDPVTMEVFSNRLLSITEDMAIHMMRSSFSAQIKERRDFSVGLFDAQGRMIAQGTHVPLHLASLIGSMEAVLQQYPASTFSDGDAYICNDPYLSGGSHLPDISIISPTFWKDQLVGFMANIGHHSDVGGSTPGSTSAMSKTLFEEGIRIPAIRIAHKGQIDDNVMRLIATNSRLSDERQLDLNVQILTNQRGAAAFRKMLDQNGLDAVNSAIESILQYTSTRLANRIRELASGRHSFVTYLDDDGYGGDQVPIKATVEKVGSELVIDFEGTGKQARGAVNVPTNAVRATVYYCVKALLDPELMPNSGMFDGIKIKAPQGSIVNPTFPAAVGARSITAQKIAGAIFGAFRELLPERRIIASNNDVLPSILFSGNREDGTVYVCGETLGGGSGALNDLDGMDAIHVHCTNTLNMPIEALEYEFPLRVDEYALVESSGGSGRQRGGLGIARQFRALKDNTNMNCRSDSHKRGAEGADGGGFGGTARLIRDYGTPEEKELNSKVAGVLLNIGDTVRIQTAGGGGFGPASERSIELIAADLKDGMVSREQAERDYGVERVREALAL
ncbi:hydantoinase B/oxoprolinase family protein [Agrobacterium vitis]|uniref:hydantoinase B/oxoprolinase family protein n=1 Tax=Agrobacterium vitis TaxID=373 RepID=UPI003D2AEB11